MFLIKVEMENGNEGVVKKKIVYLRASDHNLQVNISLHHFLLFILSSPFEFHMAWKVLI